VAGRPLRPATRRRLGGPLPHQQADRPRAHPGPSELSRRDHAIAPEYPVLAQVSLGYPGVRGRLPTCYSPVRRSPLRRVTLQRFPLDLHVLGTPPAFVLSQDQTLRREPLDPAVKTGFGFVVGKSASPSSTPGSAFLYCSFRTTVEPAGTANRTSRDQRGKRTGFWHTVQFSRCERRPEGRDSKKMGSRDPPW
jgi:hypothetical protein